MFMLLQFAAGSPNFYPRVGLLALCLALCYYSISLHNHYSKSIEPLSSYETLSNLHLISLTQSRSLPVLRYPVCSDITTFLDKTVASLNDTTTSSQEEEREKLEALWGLYDVMKQVCRSKPGGESPSSFGVIYTGAVKHFPKLVLSLYSLKIYLKSYLPVEVWTPPEDLDSCRMRLEAIIPDLTCRSLDEGITGWTSKMAAMRKSRFEHVVFLDSDSIPLLDPALFFDMEEYKATGAIFWPDYWGDACKDIPSEGNIFKAASRSSPIFTNTIAGLQFKEEWSLAQEMETGQMVLDLSRHRALLDVVAYMTRPDTYFQKILYGDKDAFRYAWLFMRQPFYYVRLPPGHTGYNQDKQAFQRNGIVQYLGNYTNPVFFHQLSMEDPKAFEHVAYPRLDKRPYDYSYCARLHGDYWVWGIDLGQDEFVVTTYEGKYLAQTIAMFDFGRDHGFW